MMKSRPTTVPPVQTGRLPAAQRAERERQILDAALAEIVEHGYAEVTSTGIARRARASKQTLYAWFGGVDGIVEALIERSADESLERTHAAVADDAAPREALLAVASGLLTLLTSPVSVALNRAAMSSPALSQLLLRSGRHRTGPVVERYLAGLHERGVIVAEDPSATFRLFYGLAVQDSQITVLLGERRPSAATIRRQAELAVSAFLKIVAPDADADPGERQHPTPT